MVDVTIPKSDLPTKQNRRVLQAVVVFSTDTSAIGRKFRIGGQAISLGRGPEAKVTIGDDRISREHCVIEWDSTTQSPVIADQGSSNGTLVNGCPQQRLALEDGSIIRIGDTLLVVEAESGSALLTDDDSVIKGNSTTLGQLRHSIQTAAPTRLSVLIMGETGTGKELVASEVHRLSKRDGKLVVVNCAAIPENLIESTLFGHVRGAFTGATSDRNGLFVEANGGTLFLDEVGELDLALQPKLLRVLEDQQVTPVGGNRSRTVDVRIVAATNVALEQAVTDGQFRADLLARLEDWPILTPALRNRPADVVSLFTTFLEQSNPVSIDAMEALLVYDWPRNVRELNRLARRLNVALPDGQAIDLTDLPDAIADNLRDRRENAEPDTTPKEPLTRESIIDALKQVEGNVTRAAKLLGCGRKTLYRRLTDFAIDAEKYRPE